VLGGGGGGGGLVVRLTGLSDAVGPHGTESFAGVLQVVLGPSAVPTYLDLNASSSQQPVLI
jgi:hypothetical protein